MRTATRAVVSVLALGLALATPVAAVADSAAPPDATDPTPAAPTPDPGPTAQPEPGPTPTPSEEPAAPPAADPAAPVATPEPELAPASGTDPLDGPYAAALPGPTSPVPAPDVVDGYAPYDPQAICDPTPKPGTVYLQNLVLAHYGTGRRSGISRACDVGGTSEHKEGRAFDWGLNIANPVETIVADSFVEWLTAPGPDGRVGYNARRLGVMHVIWNRRIWSNSSQNAGWRAYNGSSPHTDHVHVSLSWDGALMRTSWWTGVAAPTRTAMTHYVTQVYADLFDRGVDGEGLTGWTNALKRGTPRVAVANAITSSIEYRSRLITGVYREMLGRAPDPVGLAGWLDAMGRGLTIQEMEGGFLASEEHYANAGGTAAGWVAQLYRQVLGREAAPQEIDAWAAALARGESRTRVASGFLVSTERLSTVVDGYYQLLLDRGIDSVGQAGWVAAVQRGVRTEEIIGGIVASEEYFTRAQRLAAS